jgi:membrane protein
MRTDVAHVVQLAQRSVSEYFADRSPQVAAAISYYALFSIFPLALVTIAVFGLVLGDGTARNDVVDFIVRQLPVTETQGRRDIEEALRSVSADAGPSGAIGLAGLLFAASGLMGAVRNGVNTAWDVTDRRPPLQGKLLDLLLVLGVGLLIAASTALSVGARLAGTATDGLGSPLLRSAVLDQIVAFGLAFGLFMFLYRVLPASRSRIRDIWPGALAAAAGYELAKAGFSFYLTHFASYSAVYGPLGAVIAFMVFVFAAANVFLLGAEVASEWPAVRAGCSDDRPPESLRARIAGLARGLVVRGTRDSRARRIGLRRLSERDG